MQVSSDFIVAENSECNETLGFHENANSNETEGPNATLKGLELKFYNGLIIAYLSINSIRKKFDFLKVITSSNIDILAIAEIKLDDTFPPVNSYWMVFIHPFAMIEIGMEEKSLYV